MFQSGDPETKRAGGKGGTAVKIKYGHEFYTEIGRKGGQTRWAKARERRAASSPPIISDAAFEKLKEAARTFPNPLVVEAPEKQEN